MKKMDYQNVKGTQDYLPQEEETRRWIRRALEDVFIQYGCKPLETPILNYEGLLASKYGGGADILEEMYTLSDRGGRELALRYDLTIPFAKVMAMNPQISLPFKRYEIGKVFRDGPIKTGRLREFTQCDVDIAGIGSQAAEAELMMMAVDAFEKLGLPIVIQYNNRSLLTGLLQVFGTPEDQINSVVLILDKLEKIGLHAIAAELEDQQLPNKTVKAIMDFLEEEKQADMAYFMQYENVNDTIRQGAAELQELQQYIKAAGIDSFCCFNPLLARGLEIYTGTVYEIFLKDESIKSSIGSGGRYDHAIGGLLGTGESISTVGISLGLDVIYTAIKRSGQDQERSAGPEFYIIPMNTLKESLLVARTLRRRGCQAELDLSGRKLGKALERANKERAAKAVIVGKNEVEQNQILIKDMKTGEERREAFDFRKE